MTYQANGYMTGLTAGTAVSGPYGGRRLSLLESELTHPTHTDGLVDKGDPVIVGGIVGIALTSADADTDYIVVDTEGIYNLSVSATDNGGDSAVAIGDVIYIDSSAGLSKDNTGTAFGHALGAITAGETGVIAVKVKV